MVYLHISFGWCALEKSQPEQTKIPSIKKNFGPSSQGSPLSLQQKTQKNTETRDDMNLAKWNNISPTWILLK